jgi:hypothetical protein
MEFLDGPKARRWIKTLVNSSDRCDMAVAFWGVEATKALGLNRPNLHTRIVCNLTSGATSPSEIEKLRRSANVRHCSTLNTAVYIFPEAAVIGSSNASANGLAWQGHELKGWTEYNVLVDKPDDVSRVSAWFNHVWSASSNIKNHDIDDAYEVFFLRRSHLKLIKCPQAPNDGSDFLNLLVHNPGSWADRRIYLYVYSRRDNPGGNKEIEKARRSQGVGCEFDAFLAWDQIPDGSDLVTISFDGENGFVFDGCWEIPKGLNMWSQKTLTCHDEEFYALCMHSESWNRALLALKSSDMWSCKACSAIIDLNEFVRRFVIS